MVNRLKRVQERSLMDQKSQRIIREIKSRVTGMLEERQELSGHSAAVAPSKFWSDICSFFDYVLWLPEHSFSRLRLHTYHLTGDNYQTYYFGKFNVDSFEALWKQSVAGIPLDFVLSEPKGLIKGIGFEVGDGRLVSHDILRFQHVFNTLYLHGVISSLANSRGPRKIILEIGGGYGGLAHHLSRILGNITYIIVDLPETLLFSGVYLSLLNPQKEILIYQRNEFKEPIRLDVATNYDFIIVPNYKIDALRELQFDLVINVASLQEMRVDQANDYLDFIHRTCVGTSYSWNQDAQPQNREISDLSQMLKTRFELDEVLTTPVRRDEMTGKEKVRIRLKKVLRQIAILVGLMDRPKPMLGPSKQQPPSREYLCRPLGNAGRETGGRVSSLERLAGQ